MCNPAYFTVGALVHHLRRLRDEVGLSVQEILDSYVFVTAGSCGPCRFGMYEEEFRLALRNSGFEGFRVIAFQEKGGLRQSHANAGLVIDARFAERFVTCLMLGDLLNDLVFQIRPYEIVSGQTERTFAKVDERMCAALRESSVAYSRVATGSRLGMLRMLVRRIRDDALIQALMECANLIDSEIEVDYTRPKVLCKVTGEFWAQLTEGDGNFRLFQFLESEGAEVIAEPVMTWVNYLIDTAAERLQAGRGGTVSTARGRRGSRWATWKGIAALRVAGWFLNRDYERMRQALRGTPHPQIPQSLLRKLARPFFHTHIAGGEGHMEIGKVIYYATRGKAHLVVSVKPFGCLPSTQSDGVQPAVAASYARQGHDIAFVPVETSGDGAVHAYSRILVALEDARRRCGREFAAALERTGIVLETVRAACRENREYRRPLCAMAHEAGCARSASRALSMGPEASAVVGRAAQFVTYIGARMSTRAHSEEARAWQDALEPRG